MGITELILIGIGLSMDAFAVSVTNGLCHKDIKLGKTFMTGACFGGFQGLMPLIGYFLGIGFAKYITAFDHIIALILLGFIGGQMIFESFKKDEEENKAVCLTAKMLFMQGIATSIDALAVGVSFAALKDVNIAFAAAAICCITFAFSIAGVYIGKKFGTALNNKAQLVGGLILVGIGVKIFIEHTFF
ncbi:MAG: manganese efflux pump MntP family protein [Clostridium sp.]|nr:manganese efflux pump MntP family protein [Clostridium sp.]MCM1547420.1 manganese efflux pump MntP family protein [Ruminococcus sp.]